MTHTNGHKVHSDATLMSWTKEQLIAEIRNLEQSWKLSEDTAAWQYKLIKHLTEKMPVGDFEKLCSKAWRELE